MQGQKRASLRRRKTRAQILWTRLVTCCSGRPGSSYESRPNCPNRVSWDEACIEKDMSERGVLYGTQVIDDAPTPFLVYDSQMSRAEGAIVEVGEGHNRSQVDIADLQARLGVLQQRQEDGIEVAPKATTFGAIEEENRRRREAGNLLRGGGDRAALVSRRAECSQGAAMAFRAGIARNAADEEEEEEEEENTKLST